MSISGTEAKSKLSRKSQTTDRSEIDLDAGDRSKMSQNTAMLKRTTEVRDIRSLEFAGEMSKGLAKKSNGRYKARRMAARNTGTKTTNPLNRPSKMTTFEEQMHNSFTAMNMISANDVVERNDFRDPVISHFVFVRKLF